MHAHSIIKYSDRRKLAIYGYLFSREQPFITQLPKEKKVIIRKGRSRYETDIFSLEKFLKGKGETLVFRRQNKPSKFRIIDVERLR